METDFQEIHRFFARYRNGLRFRKISRYYAGCLLGLLVAALLLPESFAGYTAWMTCLLSFLLCLGYGMLVTRQHSSLKQLYLKHPSLAEALYSCLQLSTNKTPESSSWWLQQHLKKTNTLLKQTPEIFQCRFIRIISGLVLLQTLFAFSLVPSIRDSWNTLTGITPHHPSEYSCKILFASYLRKDAEFLTEVPKTLSLPQGSRLEISYTGKESPPSGNYYKTATDQNALEWNDQADRWLLTFSPQTSGTLYLSGTRQRHSLEILPDQPPTVEVQWSLPPYIFDASNLSVVLKVQDDHGLQSIILHYRIEGLRENHQ
ncbi:MAG: DUF4175 family protein, partial [SAR324 cluster bacterium]|nr:DUF4175 family protein [SAR324 cluster bacterium]